MADKKTGIAIAAAAAAAAIIPGLPRDIDVTRYTVCSSKIHTPVRMMILSDLHNADYGMNMEDLMVKVLAEKPDLILMPGDMGHMARKYKSDGSLLKTLGQPDGITRGELQRTAKNVLTLALRLNKR